MNRSFFEIDWFLLLDSLLEYLLVLEVTWNLKMILNHEELLVKFRIEAIDDAVLHWEKLLSIVYPESIVQSMMLKVSGEYKWCFFIWFDNTSLNFSDIKNVHLDSHVDYDTLIFWIFVHGNYFTISKEFCLKHNHLLTIFNVKKCNGAKVANDEELVIPRYLHVLNSDADV